VTNLAKYPCAVGPLHIRVQRQPSVSSAAVKNTTAHEAEGVGLLVDCTKYIAEAHSFLDTGFHCLWDLPLTPFIDCHPWQVWFTRCFSYAKLSQQHLDITMCMLTFKVWL
jgi:hypothetical protein